MSEDTDTPECRCGEPVDYGSWHSCPYKEEILCDDSQCNCCDECRNQCAQDI